MKRAWLAAMVSAGIFSLQGGNLWENPGFETWNDSSNLPSGKNWRWHLPKLKQKSFEVFERSSREKHSGKYSLHLKDSDKSKNNQSLGFVVGGKEIAKYRGKMMNFSGWIKQISASSPGTVGLSVFIKNDRGPSRLEQRMIDSSGETNWGFLSILFAVPEDATLLIASITCVQGFGNMAEAYFDDITLSEGTPLEGNHAVPELRKQDGAGEKKAVAPDSALLTLYPALPSWNIRLWGGLSWEKLPGTTPEMNFVIGKKAASFAGIRFETDALNRKYDFSQISPEQLKLRFRLSKELRVFLKIDGFQINPEQVASSPRGGFLYRFPLTKWNSKKPFGDVQFQFPDKLAPGERLTMSSPEIYSEKTACVPKTAISEVAETYKKSYEAPMTVNDDGFRRPEIRSGTWYLDGKPHFFLGPWIYNRGTTDWNKNANPLNISHIAYQKAPGNDVFQRMGFNSAQISAAHAQPGQALYGLAISKKIQETERNIAKFFSRLHATPMVLDFAFGFNESLKKDNPTKYKELDQRLGSWHAFIPFCPEHPDGDRYYRDYMLGGVKAALKNHANIYVYELFNESAYGCQCRFNAKEFSVRMEKKYKSIENANRKWKTVFRNFGEVAKVTNFQQYKCLWPDWCKFSGDRYAEILKKYADLIRTVDRRKNIYFTEQAAGLPPAHTGMDYRKIAEVLDVLTLEGGWRYGFNSNLSARNEMENVVVGGGSSHWFNCDFYQALAKGKKPVMNDEHYCTRLEHGIRVPSKKEDMITSLWMEVLHGTSSNYTYVLDKRSWEWKTYEQAKANVLSPSYKGSSLLNPYNWPVSELDAFQIFRKEFEPYQDRVLPFPRTKPASVAVVYSYATLRMSPFYSWNFNRRMTDWYASILHAQIPVKIVFENELGNLYSQGIRAIVFPAADYIPEEIAGDIEKFIKAGGIVLAESNAFAWNEYSEKIKGLERVVRFGSKESGKAADYLLKHGIAPHGKIIPADGGKELSMTDLQIVDRNDFKLIFSVAMGEISSRLIRMELNINDSNTYYLYSPVLKKIWLNGKSERWTATDLKKGFLAVFPSQERVIWTLETVKPANAGTISESEIRTMFESSRTLEKNRLDAFREKEKGLREKYRNDRVWNEVIPTKCKPVDLRKFVNMDFQDKIAGDKKGGWFDQGGNDFVNMPLGKQTLAGVPFEIINPKQNFQKGAMILFGTNRDYFPKEIRNIPVQSKVGVLYFLHTMGWENKERVLSYRVCYENGSTLDIPVIGEQDIGGWWGTTPLPNAKIALESFNSEKNLINLQCFRWKNPNPEQTIRSLDVISAQSGAVPAIVGITLQLP